VTFCAVCGAETELYVADRPLCIDCARDSAPSQREQAQRLLIDLINADLDLTFTLLRTADMDRGRDPKGRALALTKARSVLDAIRRLEASVTRESALRKIQGKVEELEAALTNFET
jgi:hypothetical protein